MINVGVTGALGRMGSSILKSVYEDESLNLSCVIEAPEKQGVGEDIGELLGLGNINKELISSSDLQEKELEKLDVLIDFTSPKASIIFSKIAKENKVNLVIGTTGFTEEQEKELEKNISEGNISAVISPNYAVGINVFWKLVEEAVRALDYDAEIVEVHHNNKRDAPSGTAKKTGELIRKIRGEGELVHGREGIDPREKKEIGVHAVRAGDIIGDHTLYLSGNDSGERIEITHRAQSRKPFINGAIKSAKFVVEQDKGIYGMKDVLDIS